MVKTNQIKSEEVKTKRYFGFCQYCKMKILGGSPSAVHYNKGLHEDKCREERK